MVIENDALCRHLADCGAAWDGGDHLSFPRALMEGYIDAQRHHGDPPPPAKFSYQGGLAGRGR